VSEIPYLVSHAEVCNLLRYDEKTGFLFWKERGVHYFKHDGRISADARMRAWNTRRAGKPAFTADNGGGYKKGLLLGKKYKAHRLIWFIVYGEWPPMIDHINGDPSDNRILNLRSADISINMRNMRRRVDNTSGKSGVSYNKRGRVWISHISVNGKRIHLGRFKTYDEAIVRRAAAEKKHGYCGRS